MLNDDFGSLDDSGDDIALLQSEFVGAAARDGTLDEVVPNPNNDMGHDIAELNLFYFPSSLLRADKGVPRL